MQYPQQKFQEKLDGKLHRAKTPKMMEKINTGVDRNAAIRNVQAAVLWCESSLTILDVDTE